MIIIGIAGGAFAENVADDTGTHLDFKGPFMQIPNAVVRAGLVRQTDELRGDEFLGFEFERKCARE